MSAISDLLQAWIDERGSCQSALASMLDDVEESGSLAQAQVRLAKRFAKGLTDFEAGRASALDLAVLVRQLVHSFNQRFWLPAELWEAIASLDRRAGLQTTAVAGDRVEVTAQPWQTDWLAGTEDIDALVTRRVYRSAPGSGALAKAYGYLTYQSDAQKVAVETCQFSPPGSTTLITLPTGGGKSLCTILPAWIRSQGGARSGGTTIVVVPTVALALDQYTSARRYFCDARGANYEPQCWSGSTSEVDRKAIQEAVENGTVPLLFTSPESLLLSRLRQAVLDAAKRGNLVQVVIDEAHIVESWGAQFRAEFQLLGAFLKEVSAASDNQLRITLLSATVDQRAEDLLERLFARDSFTIVRANAIRAEPSWWLNWATGVADRQSKVIEALEYLPRPAILYVTSPSDSDDWLRLLREQGYSRVASFTGKTQSGSRESVLERWQNDELDLMVATSAFGLGIDKADVRTVVHACLPETIDRFYQEVGRGGRDGNSCVSLICAIEDDLRIAIGLTSASIITTEKAVSRWLGMRKTAEIGDVSDLISVDVDAAPLHDLDMLHGARIREWNMHTLLLLQRAKLLEITGSALPIKEDDASVDWQDRGKRLVVRLLDPIALQGIGSTLATTLDPARESERQRIERNAFAMKELVTSSSKSSDTTLECVARRLARLYPDCSLACGGCPACREENRSSFSDPLEFFIEQHGTVQDPPASRLDGKFAASIGTRARLTILKPNQEKRTVELVAALVEAGVVQIIAPDEWLDYSISQAGLIHGLSEHSFLSHVIVPARWVRTRQDLQLRNLPTAVIYPGRDQGADTLFRQIQHQWRRIPVSTPLISIIKEGTYLPSESGRFVDRVPGVVASGDDVLQQLRTPSQEWF